MAQLTTRLPAPVFIACLIIIAIITLFLLSRIADWVVRATML